MTIPQIYGEKEFILYHPDDSSYMYSREGSQMISKVSNVFDPGGAMSTFGAFK